MVEQHQELSLVGVSRAQTVEGDEAGGALKDAVEARPQFAAGQSRSLSPKSAVISASKPSGSGRTRRSTAPHRCYSVCFP